MQPLMLLSLHTMTTQWFLRLVFIHHLQLLSLLWADCRLVLPINCFQPLTNPRNTYTKKGNTTTCWLIFFPPCNYFCRQLNASWLSLSNYSGSLKDTSLPLQTTFGYKQPICNFINPEKLNSSLFISNREPSAAHDAPTLTVTQQPRRLRSALDCSF